MIEDNYKSKEELKNSWFPNSNFDDEVGFHKAEQPENGNEQTTAEKFFPNSLRDESDSRSLEEAIDGGPITNLEIKTLTGENKLNTNGYKSVRDYAENAALGDMYLADLGGQNLSGLNVAIKDFSYSGLNGANLSNSKMKGTDFRGADLRGADLRGTDLRQAIFDKNTRIDSSTRFENTDVEAADFSQVDGLTQAQMKGMRNLHKAKLK